MSDIDAFKMICNPFYAIEIDPTLSLPHKPLIPERLWIQNMCKLIEEEGAEKTMQILLEVLKGDYPKN
jgi:hypothetical protein